MERISYLRQLDILDPEELKNIDLWIIGAGSIGSFLCLTLSKMGFWNIGIVDDDKISSHNIPNQFYRTQDIGRSKVEALKDICHEFSNCSIGTFEDRIENADMNLLYPKTLETVINKKIVISAVDSMKSRKMIWNIVKNDAGCISFIDIRTAGETVSVLTIVPWKLEYQEFYEKTLYSDKEAIDLPCTAQNIIYSVLMASSLAANQIKKVVMKEEFDKHIIFDLKTVDMVKVRE